MKLVTANWECSNCSHRRVEHIKNYLRCNTCACDRFHPKTIPGYPCDCGHSKQFHVFRKHRSDRGWSAGCIKCGGYRRYWGFDTEAKHPFSPMETLKYLEWKHNQNVL